MQFKLDPYRVIERVEERGIVADPEDIRREIEKYGRKQALERQKKEPGQAQEETNGTTPQETYKNVLEYDENGKPKLELIILEETAVHVPTLEEYDTLMQIYDCAGRIWRSGDLPTDYQAWHDYEENTCIQVQDYKGNLDSPKFGYMDVESCKDSCWNIISFQEFCEIQGITPEMIKELNTYFEKHNPDRKSKG